MTFLQLRAWCRDRFEIMTARRPAGQKACSGPFTTLRHAVRAWTSA